VADGLDSLFTNGPIHTKPHSVSIPSAAPGGDVTPRDQLEPSPYDGLQVSQPIVKFLQKIWTIISTRPSGWGQVQQDKSRLEPWFTHKDSNGTITVTVPSDIESFADDSGVVACIAAIKRLNANIIEGLPMATNPELWQRCHPDTDLYYHGISALFKDGCVRSFPNYSGWFGKGYNLIARRRLANEGIKPWAIRGSAMPLRKIWSHKAWGETLPLGYKHLEMLFREAADSLELSEEGITTWMVPLSAIKGTKVKRSLAVSKGGFLLQPDIDALNIRFHDGIKAYEDFETEMSKPNKRTFIELETKIASTNKAIATLESTASKIIETRAKLLYPPIPKTRGRKPKKVPLKEKLLNLDPILFINRFGPYEACGVSPFTTSEEASIDPQSGALRIAKLEQEFTQYTTRQPVDMADVLRSWWNTEVLPRYG
jgi:hypothetical protein